MQAALSWIGWLSAALLLLALPRTSHAVPSFAAQTGQPCTACHVGAFGPQLTPLGRAFKIGGYTQTGGEGIAAKVPLAAMTLTSFTNTQKGQPEPPARGFGQNNNFALDQISLFLAGRVTDNLGGFVQGTFSGVDRAFSLDNTDIRLTAPFDLKNSELRLGVSVNNGPTVQDPYNTDVRLDFSLRRLGAGPDADSPAGDRGRPAREFDRCYHLCVVRPAPLS